MANKYTWRQVMKAAETVAKRYEGELYFTWLRKVDALKATTDKTLLDKPYTGPGIDGWAQTLGAERVNQIKDELSKISGKTVEPTGTTEPPVMKRPPGIKPGEVRLNVPYISQWDPEASDHSADCGPTCLAMIINAEEPSSQHVKVDELYDKYLPHKKENEYTNFPEMIEVGQHQGLNAGYKKFHDKESALKGLHEMIDQGRPLVALVNYGPWESKARNNYNRAHFVVVTGYDKDYVMVHDPLFSGDRRDLGEYYKWPNDTFLEGWGTLDQIRDKKGKRIQNPNYAAVITSKSVKRISA